MDEAFAMRGVRKSYKEFTLEIDSLSLERGYVMGLVGRNGAGKSTTIKILMNLVYPHAGEVRVLGLRQPGADIEIKRRVGYLSEEPVFYREMTVGWMAGLVKRYYPTWDDRLFQDYLRKFALDPRKKIKELSRGMRVKLGLTLALSHRPELLILDEPTSGLDPVGRHELLEEIGEVIRNESRTVLLSSHITQDIQRVADHIAIIDRGKVVEKADKESLLDRWKRVTGVLPSASAPDADCGLPRNSAHAHQSANLQSSHLGGPHADRNGAGLRAMFADLKTDGKAFDGVTGSFSSEWLEKLKGAGARDLRVIDIGLDEILLTLTGKGE